MKEVDIHFPSEEEHNRLRAIRDKHGVTWRGMVIQGAKELVGSDLRRSLTLTDQIDSEAFEAVFWMPDEECCDRTSQGRSQQSAGTTHETAATPEREQRDRQDTTGTESSDGKTEAEWDGVGDDKQSSVTDIAESASMTTSIQDPPAAGEHPHSLAIGRPPRTENDPTEHGHSHDP